MQRLGNSLAVRLTVWFLLLSFLPLGVMAVFVRRNVAGAFIESEVHHHRSQAEVLAAGISLLDDDDRDSVQALLAAAVDGHDAAFIVDENGRYVAHSDEDQVTSSAYADFATDVVEQFLSGGSGAMVEAETGRMVGYSVVPGRSVSKPKTIVVIVTDQPVMSALMSDVEWFSFIQLAVSLIIISIAGGAVIWVVAGSPIRQLTRAAEQIGAGNLEVAVDPDDMEDELKVLARTFNQMTGRLRELVGGLEQHVAKLQQAEEALAESHKRLLTVLDSIDADIYVADIETYAILFMNEHLRVSFGQDLVSKICWEVFREETGPCTHCTNDQLLDADGNPAGVVIWEGYNPITGRWYINYDRAIRWVDQRLVRLQVATDITEYKKAEEERARLLAQIQEQAQRVQQIVDTVPEGVILLDAAGQIVLANPMGKKDLLTLANANVGDTLTNLATHPLSEFLTWPAKKLWHELTADERSFQIIARPLESGPEPQGWVLVIRDVTQQREVERRAQQQERLAAVGQLAAGIAHDFNNIMATIVLYAQMAARSEGVSTLDRERMETINQQALYATQLIQQILDFSRRAVIERRPMDMLVFLKEQVKLLERTLPESIKIDLVYDTDEHATSFTVNADPTRVQQAIMNLAVNARDAMRAGGELRIELERLRIESGKRPPLPEIETGEWVRIQVSDTGMGIPPDALAHIFEPFFTTKPVGEGTGLGLAQVWGIVKQHDGHIGVVSRENEGATFSIYLPALRALEVKTPAQEPPPVSPGHGETILLVEDNPTVREALVQSLDALGYLVLAAANGREALPIFERHADEIALVLSDMVMPGMGGVALLHTLRNQGWIGPAIILTGHPLRGENGDLPSGGVVEWLQKPIDLEKLAQMLARIIV